METLGFTAKSIFVENNIEDGYWMVGIADDPEDYRHYVIAQRAFEYSEQDKALGMASHYLEVDGQENSAYGCVLGIKRTESIVVFRIDNRKIKGLDEIVVNIGGVEIPDTFDTTLKMIFENVKFELS